MTVITSGAGTAYPSGAPELTPVFSEVRVTRSLDLFVMFCKSLFVLLTFSFGTLCCLSFFDVRIMITPLRSSSSFDVFASVKCPI
jgi:hypothetical protein